MLRELYLKQQEYLKEQIRLTQRACKHKDIYTELKGDGSSVDPQRTVYVCSDCYLEE